MSLVFIENKSTDALTHTHTHACVLNSRGKLTAEEAVAVEQEAPAHTHHHHQADHHRRRHHRRDVNILWKGHRDESAG